MKSPSVWQVQLCPDLLLWSPQVGLLSLVMARGTLQGTTGKISPYIPHLQDVGDISRGEDPSDVIEVSHIEAPIGATGEGHGGQELVAISKTVAAGAGDAPPAPVAHDAADDRGLLGHELVLPIPFVQDAWDKERCARVREQGLRSFSFGGQGYLDFAKDMQPLPDTFVRRVLP